jgi:hypothetical protein
MAKTLSPTRIAPILERLRKVWEANPDKTLGELVADAELNGEDEFDPAVFMEDGELIARIESAYGL